METGISSAEFHVLLCYDGVERKFRSICTQIIDAQPTQSPKINLAENAIISQEEKIRNDRANFLSDGGSFEKETISREHSSSADVSLNIDDDSITQRKVKFAHNVITVVEPTIYADDEYGLGFDDDDDIIKKQPPTRYSYAKGEWMGRPVSQWIDDSYLRLPAESEPPPCGPRTKTGICHPIYVDDSIDLLNLPELLQVSAYVTNLGVTFGISVNELVKCKLK
ncbi:hypothetical protein EG68_11853 [Paragonimus skrjabini miyazakii]|uniref:Uncharacterized protein n=1 Tax=Paragonimus skrjabini miyazakii TaxID=59628 RepID=A0A8S9YFZ3_9TREM|nr:hypothetical protein EG68_11853 [Paragonimus skrjabini miyazakii]